MEGILNKNYHLGRKKRIDLKYRLKKRTDEILKAIETGHPKAIQTILDLGTADGLMLGEIKKKYPAAKCIGIEYSKELIETNLNQDIEIIQGDVQNIPFNENKFDVVIAAAVIEHLKNPEKMITEAYRVLKNNGILIITTPSPFFEKIASRIGGLAGDHHQITFNLKTLNKLLTDKNFKVLESKKFMISPIGFPLENSIEKILNILKLNFTLLNQIVTSKAQKK